VETNSQFHPQQHTIFLYFTMYQTNNLLNEFVNVHRPLLGATFLDQRANPPNHVARPLPVPNNGATAARASSRFGVPLASHRKQALALVTTAASG
jgi:hypothetical protein